MKKTMFLAVLFTLLGAMTLTSCHKPEPEIQSEYDTILTDDGLYLSIYAFNNGIVAKMDYTKVTESSVSSIQGWIRSLNATDDATSLLYTVDSSLNALKRTKFPESLYSLNVVSFTDGIDNASVYFANNQWNTNYQNRNEYQAALKDRLRNSTFHGHNMEAYGIGVQSSSIDPTVFRSTIEDLSSCDDNAQVLSDFSQVSAQFGQIASNITTYNSMTDVTLAFACGGTDRIAFVFDGAPNPDQSYCKIEATLNSNNTLSDIVYTGLTSSSAATIAGVHGNGSIFSFTFKNLRTTNNDALDCDHVKLFKQSLGLGGTTYAQDVEFNPASQTHTEVVKKTAGIILVLDVSSSLGNNFNSVQNAACNFVYMLAHPVQSNKKGTPRK